MLLAVRLGLREVRHAEWALTERLLHRIVRDRSAADPRLHLHTLRLRVPKGLLRLHLPARLLRYVLEQVHFVDLIITAKGFATIAEPEADIVLEPVAHTGQKVSSVLRRVTVWPLNHFELLLWLAHAEQAIVLVTDARMFVGSLHHHSQVAVTCLRLFQLLLQGLRRVPPLGRVRSLQLHRSHRGRGHGRRPGERRCLHSVLATVVAVRGPVRVHQLDQVWHLAAERHVDVLNRDRSRKKRVRLLQGKELDDTPVVVGDEAVAELKAAGQCRDISEALHVERVGDQFLDLPMVLL